MIPLAQNMKRYFSFKGIIILIAAIIFSVSAGIGVFSFLKKDVVIHYNGKQTTVKTMKSTVKEVLEQNGITVSPDDYVSLPVDSFLQKTKVNEITIKSAIPIYVSADRKEVKVMTYREALRDALENSVIKLTPRDKIIGRSSNERVVEGMKVKIVRVKEDLVTEKITIPYKTVTKENNYLNKGSQKVIREGKNGVRQKQFQVVYEDGKVISKKLLSDKVESNPVTKIQEVGTVLNFKTSRGDVVRYKKVIDMSSTAYTANYQCTGKNPGDPGFGITRTGMKVRRGVVAVDPRVIPLGTKLYVQIAGDTPDYGFAIAADTGSAVKNKIIDLYFEDAKAVNRWGRKKAKVYILAD